MSNLITIIELEASINRCRHRHPTCCGELLPDLQQLATMYAEMIFWKSFGINIDTLAPSQRVLLLRWLGA